MSCPSRITNATPDDVRKYAGCAPAAAFGAIIQYFTYAAKIVRRLILRVFHVRDTANALVWLVSVLNSDEQCGGVKRVPHPVMVRFEH